jgi:putative heme-binding domain-containing protein
MISARAPRANAESSKRTSTASFTNGMRIFVGRVRPLTCVRRVRSGIAFDKVNRNDGMRMWAVRVCTFMLAASTLLAQETDLDLGKRLFLTHCAACHGPDGNSVQGVDLGRRKLRRASSDDDIIQIIKTGIPNTAMPPIGVSTRKAKFIVAYLRSMMSSARAPSPPGNAVRGKALFEGKGDCLSCHRVKDRGSRVGPDLTDIGARRRSFEVESSLLEPNAEILPENQFVRVITRDGAVITGRLLNHDAFTVQLIDSAERLLSFQKSSLKEFAFLDESPMPSYRDKLSPEELADLVSYLVSLKGIDIQ